MASSTSSTCMVPGLPLGTWALLSALFYILVLTLFLVLSTRILTLAMRPHLHLTVHQVTTILSRGPYNHGFVRSMDSIRTTTLIPYPLLVVSQLPLCFPAP